MDTLTVKLHPKALRELQEARAWYFERSQEVATKFAQEVAHATALIAGSPMAWPALDPKNRRYVLQSFPFDVIYQVTSDEILIFAVAHHKRRPHYWAGRLPS